MAAHLPRDAACIIAAVPRSDIEFWDMNTYLLANVVDLLAAGNWQRSGGKGRRPKPLQRPTAPAQHTGVTANDITEFRDWYSNQSGGRDLT